LVKNIKYLCCLVFALFLGQKAQAFHIIGGELIYKQTGIGAYHLTLKIYRDCNGNGAGFDGVDGFPPCLITVFDGAGNFIRQLDIGSPTITLIPGSITNTCIAIQHPCVEEGIYEDTINLPPLAGGYNLIYVRCCRNSGVDNLLNGDEQGASYLAFVPGPEVVATNSSPRFNTFPPIDICANMPFTYDNSATDPDGDVLVYTFTAPFQGLNNCCPSLGSSLGSGPNCSTISACPNIPDPPPYVSVNYITPFSPTYAVASNPSLTLNSLTGMIQGKPNLVGEYVVGVVVDEFRNNVLLSRHYRDFQFAVRVCTVAVLASVPDHTQCVGNTITFTNQSTNQSSNPTYFWNFGDPTTAADTSLVFSPTYTFPDTGAYNVTLIVNRGDLCSDTLVKHVNVYPPLDIYFVRPNMQCLKSNSINFSATGTFVPSQCTFEWTFPSANPPTSSIKDPLGVKFTSAGLFSVTLSAKQFACRDTFIDSVRILGRPIAKINNFPIKLCDPGKISFSNGSASEYPGWYSWYLGNSDAGTTYNEYEPTHTFSPAGNYFAVLTMYRGLPCPDTSAAIFNSITINPLPSPGFVATPTLTTIFDPEISVVNTSSSVLTACSYDFGDGNSQSIFNIVHVYEKPGKYVIKQTVTNQFDCSATAEREIKILPEFRFWAPNAFTPDENNHNEVFTPVTIGASSYKLYIFDRWGHLIFESDEANVGWDGKIKGKTCPQDIYVWKCTFVNDVSEKKEVHMGHVTLLKATDEF
jgi:gliding motility-associated-like protein